MDHSTQITGIDHITGRYHQMTVQSECHEVRDVAGDLSSRLESRGGLAL